MSTPYTQLEMSTTEIFLQYMQEKAWRERTDQTELSFYDWRKQFRFFWWADDRHIVYEMDKILRRMPEYELKRLNE